MSGFVFWPNNPGVVVLGSGIFSPVVSISAESTGTNLRSPDSTSLTNLTALPDATSKYIFPK